MKKQSAPISDQDYQDFLLREQEIIFRLASAIEYRQMENNNHILRIVKYSFHIAQNLDFAESELDTLTKAASLHDIGIIGIPDRILRKPGQLNNEEYTLMKKHTKIGYRIFYGSESALLKTAAEISLTHHERYNGTGYPNGLRGNTIPLSGRIVALADVFDALNSKKPYRKAWELEKIVQFIQDKSGQYFDPSCVKAFFEKWERVLQIKNLQEKIN